MSLFLKLDAPAATSCAFKIMPPASLASLPAPPPTPPAQNGCYSSEAAMCVGDYLLKGQSDEERRVY